MVATLATADSATTARPITADVLCRLYAPEVCRFAALMAASHADAEDLAQDALLRAIRSLHRFDPARGSMNAWLWRIVVNAARDAATRRQRLRDLTVRVGVLTPRESESVEDAVIGRMRDHEVRAHVAALTLRDRTLLALRYGAGLDTREVGLAVGLNADSASRGIRRALARLRARIEEMA